MIAPKAVPADAPPFFRSRTAITFSAPMIVNGIALPYFPVWLHSIGFDAAEIATILAVPMVTRVLVAPVISMVADRLGERAYVLIGSGVLSLLTAIALFFTSSFWSIAIIFGLQGAVYASFIPVTEAILLTGVRRWGYDYGRMRVWGSIAFIAASILAGWLIGENGGRVVLHAMAWGFVLVVLAGFIAPRTGKVEPPRASPSGSPGAPSVLRRPDFLLMLIGASLSQASHAMLFAFSAIEWGNRGFSGTEIGILWAAGVVAEVIVFIFAKQLVARHSYWALMLFGIAIAVARWVIYPFADGFWLFFALQCLHAFTFGTAHLGTQTAMVNRVPAHQEASAQGTYFFYNGGLMAVATFASGPLYEHFHQYGYFAMAGMCVLGFLLVVLSRSLSPKAEPRVA